MTPQPTLSSQSLAEASRDRSRFSGHGNSIGAAGSVSEGETASAFLHAHGDMAVVEPREHGYGEIRIGAAWDNVLVQGKGFINRLLKRMQSVGVDLDLGILYELQDGARGAVQAFGERFGAYDAAPFIQLSGDERTGDAPGDDEYLRINGTHWPEIKRALVYVYIYGGVPDWAQVCPRIRVGVPAEPAFIVRPGKHDSKLPVCVIAGLENVRNGIKITNYTEYYAGHDEMDRAFGYGIDWTDGSKDDRKQDGT
jgi:tellurite resistance protein TerA